MLEKTKALKFSVLMSVYYKEKAEYLDMSLNSVFQQTYMPNEVVLVKDGPLTRELENIIAKYKAQYHTILKIFSLKKNQGLGYALNYGLKYCTYNLVARMDTDDISSTTRFELQLKKFMEDSNLSVVGGEIDEYDETLSQKIGNKCVPEKDEEIKRYIKNRNPINHMSVMYKKENVIEAGGYVDCPFFEDYYLWCRMIKKEFKFYNIQETLVRVRAGSTLIARRGGLSYCKSIINFYQKIYAIDFLNIWQCIFRCVIRICVSIIPNSCRKFIYTKFLRK